MDAYSKRMMDEINNTPVSKEEIIEAVQEVGELEPGERDFTGHAITITRLHHGNPDKAKSILFRLEALAYLLSEEGAPGWAISLPNGATLTQEAVFAAAAVHPLIGKDDHFAFEREAFLEKVLELADLDEVG